MAETGIEPKAYTFFYHAATGNPFSGWETFAPKWTEFGKKAVHHEISLNIIWVKNNEFNLM